MFKQVPGHFRAYTFWLALVLAFIAWLTTGNAKASVGVVTMIIGVFLGDQTTHLAQADHSAPPPTWIERQMQRHKGLFIGFGSGLAVAGVELMFLL